MTEPRCIPLEAISDEAVGGKAEGLARLLAQGFDVPSGFVVLGASPGRLPDELDEHYVRIGAGKVAVRSSAVGEDSGSASFAGQYETVLNVEGIEALRAAIEDCLRSVENARALAYRDAQTGQREAEMNIVVQQMVDARSAGVLFTAHPVNARRDRIVVDAVSGLGDDLVSGRATPDHWLIARDGSVIERELQGDEPVLSDAELTRLVDEALVAEQQYGAPLDIEWAIDRAGGLRWLQARPITQLPADPNELDTKPNPDDVYTWCNIGEMMPGAVTPLTFSVTARGIDLGMQRAYRRMGAKVPHGEGLRYVGMYYGHLFLNLSSLSELASAVAGSTKSQMCIALCGRDIDEVMEPEPEPAWRRALNGARYFSLLVSASKHRSDLDALAAGLELRRLGTARQLYRAIDENLPQVWRAYELHLLSSSSAGALSPILLGILAKGEEPTQEHHAEVADMLAGAKDVESADIAEGVERLIELLLVQESVKEAFAAADPEAALVWICSSDAGEARDEFRRYLDRHGHRAVRELELRQKEWAVDPAPLIASLQSGLRARLELGARHRMPAPKQRAAQDHPVLRRLLPLAHAAIRTREHTKSALVAVTTAFKHAYRTLGSQLTQEGWLPDPDAVFFLTHQELGELLGGRRELSGVAVSRRRVIDYQMPLHFAEVFRNRPDPLELGPAVDGDRALVGKPVSRGKVTGRARVVETLEQAAALEAGEILIAPITDVGWTPYFSLIAGLATDVGSAVSHGAVVAREYGLPAVVNLRVATSRIQTGDLVTLDGDRGTLTHAEAEPGSRGS
ncbi:MAG: pyruvate, water dikinase [Deltaproteobacteria bacterium]|nr:pyruvate, water dikinase [Deltaproteobacteria bacterium]NND30180.1 pyruvate, water dikinase [Myxococcales bacterium]MBT8464955.1 pyruvate, water dikinase [Deltaproteobacteria bacterium]MBT8480443.1 pyruvate, water dikinase [Deltaproteobacteria bacterium]NNK07295.1 pyruvate, water dikinase [Myxococcales bacterium]